jgi:DNA invertase Pin-like site-specific DNA recombinase
MFVNNLKVVGYVRSGHTDVTSAEQIQALKDYCSKHGYRLERIFSDEEELSLGYTDSLNALSEVNGLITYDVTRLVSHPSDSFRELRPLFKNRFMRTGKKILTVAEGIENITASGQANIIELMNEWSRREELKTSSGRVFLETVQEI